MGLQRVNTIEHVCTKLVTCNNESYKVSHSVVSNSFETPWTITHQVPLSMGFSRQEYWSGLPCPPPGELPNPGIKPGFPTFQAILYHLSYQGSLYKHTMHLV